MELDNKYAEVSEKILEILITETNDSDEMIRYLGYTASMLLNISYPGEGEYLATLNFIKCLCVSAATTAPVKKLKQGLGKTNE